MPGIGVINNPYSRRNKKNPEWMQAMGYIVGNEGKAAATKHVDDIHQMVRGFKEREIDILAINGGDGSNSLVLTALIDEYGEQALPKIALLRGGTMNIAANSCGIRGTSAGLMMNLVKKHREGVPFETTWRDTLKIENRYGFVFGNGFIQAFLDVLYAGGNKNPWTTSKLAARAVISSMTGGKLAERMFPRVEARVVVDGEELPVSSFSAMAAATVEQIGLNFKPFHRAQEKAKSFHLLGIFQSPFTLVGALPRVYAGRKVSEKKIFQTVASEVVFHSDTDLTYTLDGEVYTPSSPLTLGTGPRLEIVIR